MSHPSEPSGRPAGSQADPAYALARSRAEYERLSRQAAFLRGTTERLVRAAGLEPGMRVLDVGSGAGDVALLAAELVGPEGEVVGVDVDGAALEIARGRAQSLGLGNVSFVEGDARTAELEGGFDAAVGRLVVMYWGIRPRGCIGSLRTSGRAASSPSRSSTSIRPPAPGRSRKRPSGTRRASS